MRKYNQQPRSSIDYFAPPQKLELLDLRRGGAARTFNPLDTLHEERPHSFGHKFGSFTSKYILKRVF